MSSIIIKSLNVSTEKGVAKKPIASFTIDSKGVVGDAHAGDWHRQVSLLGTESLAKAKEINKRDFAFGDFGENITTEGLELHKTAVFDRFVSGQIILEVSQIGKKCHSGCAIFNDVGDCIMPREGIFTKVISGGILQTGDLLEYIPRIITAKIITLSDRASMGVYDDKSGPLVEKHLSDFLKANNRHYSIEREILPDSESRLKTAILDAVNNKIDIVITTGGTGIGPRDITPDVIAPLLDKQIPGIMEMIRVKYGMEKPNALISRSIAGVAGQSLIYCLPGSVKGVHEYMQEITPTIEHSIRMIHGSDVH